MVALFNSATVDFRGKSLAVNLCCQSGQCDNTASTLMRLLLIHFLDFFVLALV